VLGVEHMGAILTRHIKHMSSLKPNGVRNRFPTDKNENRFFGQKTFCVIFISPYYNNKIMVIHFNFF